MHMTSPNIDLPGGKVSVTSDTNDSELPKPVGGNNPDAASGFHMLATQHRNYLLITNLAKIANLVATGTWNARPPTAVVRKHAEAHWESFLWLAQNVRCRCRELDRAPILYALCELYERDPMLAEFLSRNLWDPLCDVPAIQLLQAIFWGPSRRFDRLGLYHQAVNCMPVRAGRLGYQGIGSEVTP